MTEKKYVNIYDEYKEKFYQIPKVFFTNAKYINLSNNAKIAWGILRDRSSISKKNRWFDKKTGNVYFKYSNADLQKILNIGSKATITKVKDELEQAGLLEQTRVGLKQCNKLYLLYPDVQDSDIEQIDELENVGNIGVQEQGNAETIDNSGSSKNELQEVQKMNPSYTNTSYTNSLDTEKEDTKKIDTEKAEKQQQFLLDNFSKTQDQTFLNSASLDLIALFSNSIDEAYKQVGIINRAKRKAEVSENKIIIAEDYQEEIEELLHKFVNKKTTDKTIKDIDNYMFVTFFNLFADLIVQSKILRKSI